MRSLKLSDVFGVVFTMMVLGFSSLSVSQVWKGDLSRGNGTPVNIDVLLSEISGTDVFLFGEQHNNNDILILQKNIIYGLIEAKTDFALSVEFVSLDQQRIISSYLLGNTGFIDFKNQVKLPRGYYSLLSIAREYSIQVLAANANKSNSYCIYKKGLVYVESIDDDLPEKLLPINKAYRYLIENKIKNSSGHTDELENLVISQAYKDFIMAQSISNLNESTEKLIVHISGRTHVEDNLGLYHYLKKENERLNVLSLVALPKKEGRSPYFENDYMYESLGSMHDDQWHGQFPGKPTCKS